MNFVQLGNVGLQLILLLSSQSQFVEILPLGKELVRKMLQLQVKTGQQLEEGRTLKLELVQLELEKDMPVAPELVLQLLRRRMTLPRIRQKKMAKKSHRRMRSGSSLNVELMEI